MHPLAFLEMTEGMIDLRVILKASNEEVKELEEECSFLMEILLRKKFKNIAEKRQSEIGRPTKRKRLPPKETNPRLLDDPARL